MQSVGPEEEISNLLLGAGASLVGFADLEPLPLSARQGFSQAVSIAQAIRPGIVRQIENGPTVEYFHEYTRLNENLLSLARLASEALKDRGVSALAVKPTAEKGEYDPESLSVPLSHKAVATRAGLGWIGRSDLLVTRSHGSAIRLATILCDPVFQAAEPVTESGCKECFRCMERCPARAITGRSWRAGVVREELYDARACLRQARASCSSLGIETSICGICIQACPWTQKYVDSA